jgi:hypothetical protein
LAELNPIGVEGVLGMFLLEVGQKTLIFEKTFKDGIKNRQNV